MKNIDSIIIWICFCLTLGWGRANAQEVQCKIYILNKNFYVPQAEKKVASFCYGPIGSCFADSADCRELPIGLLSISNRAVRYSIRDEKVVSASFLDTRDHYWGGPTIIAVSPNKMKKLDDKQVRQFIEDYGATYHDMSDQTILDGLFLRKIVFENHLDELIFDFAVSGDGSIFCFVIVGLSDYWQHATLQVWKLLDGGKELLVWGEGSTKTDWSSSFQEAKLVARLPLPEQMKELTAFAMGDGMFVFNPYSGHFYRFSESGLQQVPNALDGGKSYMDHALVIDQDQGKVYLLQKSLLRQERKAFSEILEHHGIWVPLSR